LEEVGMDFGFSKQEERLRHEVRQFCKKEVTPELIEEDQREAGFGPYIWDFFRKLGAKGWLTPDWPKEYGGLGSSYMEKFIIMDEVTRAVGGWRILLSVGASMVGPAILEYGNEEQKSRFLPPIAKGEVEYALGYTETQAGSDLAALELRATGPTGEILAEEKDDHYLMNGQKIFNTAAHYARFHWLGARTDWENPKRHQGISVFVVDLKSPGITIRPMQTMSDLMTNEVIYKDVKVPKENLIGRKNRGFYQIMTALDYERVTPSGGLYHLFEEMLAYVKETEFNGRPLAKDPAIRHRLAQLAIDINSARLLDWRVAWMINSGTVPNYQSAMSKAYSTELIQRIYNTWVDIMGLFGQLQPGSKWAPLNGRIERQHRRSVIESIYRGTNEIMRVIIAARGLGLPRE
jgi:alkylation response protein AidB-like acyl-CoA dehydrogenase